MVRQTELMQPNGITTIAREEITNTAVLLDNTAFNERHFVYPSASIAKQYEVDGILNGVLLRTVTTANTFESTGGTLYDQTVTLTEERALLSAHSGHRRARQRHAASHDGHRL